MRSFFIILSVLFYCSCEEDPITSDQVVAKVYEKYLFLPEIAQLIPKGTSSQDSALIAKNYIHKWITKELLLRKALQNLTDEEKNIRRQVEEYSSSILIHKYKTKLIAQKMESQINDSEVEEYYEQNKQNFILNTDIVKSLLIIIPKSATNIKKVRKWIRSEKAQDQADLEEYCITNAKKYDQFNDQWIELRHLLNILPMLPEEWARKYKNMKLIELEDNDNYYFLKIKELCKEKEIAPMGFVQNNIISILRNKKRIAFEEELEKQINNEAIRKNNVEIYHRTKK